MHTVLSKELHTVLYARADVSMWTNFRETYFQNKHLTAETALGLRQEGLEPKLQFTVNAKYLSGCATQQLKSQK